MKIFYIDISEKISFYHGGAEWKANAYVSLLSAHIDSFSVFLLLWSPNCTGVMLSKVLFQVK